MVFCQGHSVIVDICPLPNSVDASRHGGTAAARYGIATKTMIIPVVILYLL